MHYSLYILTNISFTLMAPFQISSMFPPICALLFPIIYFSYLTVHLVTVMSLLWRHSGRDGVSNHQPHDCLLNRLFRRRSKKTSKLRVTGLCADNSPVTGEFPAQMASNAENVSIWWRHHAAPYSHYNMIWFTYSSFDWSAIVQCTFKVV